MIRLGGKMDIKLIAFDIDGVVTSGKLIVDENAAESKVIDFRDIDAIFQQKREVYQISFLTEENSKISNYFKDRFQPDYFYNNVKKKDEIIRQIAAASGVDLNNICYVGDGKYDIAPMSIAGCSICPQNAIDEVKRVSTMILNSYGGDGFIYEVKNRILGNSYPKIESLLQRHNDVFKQVVSDSQIKAQIDRIVKLIIEAIGSDKTVYTFGNGGSAADAQHIAGEFVGRFFKERKALPCEALTANAPIITALGNDYTYDIVFSRQVEAKCKKGDVLMGLSTSGRSKNVLKAFAAGKKIGTVNIAFIGNTSNHTLEEIADIIVKIPSGITPAVQEMHMMVNHIICQLVEEEMF